MDEDVQINTNDEDEINIGGGMSWKDLTQDSAAWDQLEEAFVNGANF